MLAERQFYRGAYILFQQLHVMVDCCKMWQIFTSSRACSGIVLKMETQEWMDPICLKWCSHLLCDFQTAHFLGQLISVIAHLFNQSEARRFKICRITLSLLLFRAIRPSNNNSNVTTVITAVAVRYLDGRNAVQKCAEIQQWSFWKSQN